MHNLSDRHCSSILLTSCECSTNVDTQSKAGTAVKQCSKHALPKDALREELNKTCFLMQILPLSSVSAKMKPLLGVGQKPTPQHTESQGPCPDRSSLPDVSGTGSLMSARSLVWPRPRDAAALQQVITPAASAAAADAGTDCTLVIGGAAHVNAANVSVTQAGVYPVRQGSTGTLKSGFMPRRSLTMERLPPGSKPLASRRSLCAAKQPSAPSEVASTALQLMGAPFGSFGGSAAGQGGQLPRSSGSSVSSGGDKLARNSLLYSSQLSEGTAALPATGSDGVILAVLAPRRRTSITLGNELAKWAMIATGFVHCLVTNQYSMLKCL